MAEITLGVFLSPPAEMTAQEVSVLSTIRRGQSSDQSIRYEWKERLSDNKLPPPSCHIVCLASPDALEVIVGLTDLLTYLLIVSIDLTDVTLVSDDTY